MKLIFLLTRIQLGWIIAGAILIAIIFAIYHLAKAQVITENKQIEEDEVEDNMSSYVNQDRVEHGTPFDEPITYSFKEVEKNSATLQEVTNIINKKQPENKGIGTLTDHIRSIIEEK